MSDFRKNMSPSSNFDKRCNKCGVVLSKYHVCEKWIIRSENDKRPPRHRSKRPSPRKENASSIQPENKSYKSESIGTQTDTVANSCVSVATQTEIIDDENKDETIKEFTKMMFEKMISQRRILLDLHNLCTNLQLS